MFQQFHSIIFVEKEKTQKSLDRVIGFGSSWKYGHLSRDMQCNRDIFRTQIHILHQSQILDHFSKSDTIFQRPYNIFGRICWQMSCKHITFCVL